MPPQAIHTPPAPAEQARRPTAVHEDGRPRRKRLSAGIALTAAIFFLPWNFLPASQPPVAGPEPLAQAKTREKPTAESLTRRTLDQLKELTRVLGGVKGRATAMEAVPKIREIAEAMRNLKEDAESLGPLQPEEGDRLRDKYQKEVHSVAEKLDAAVRRVMADASIWAEIAPAMGELPPSILQGN